MSNQLKLYLDKDDNVEIFKIKKKIFMDLCGTQREINYKQLKYHEKIKD